jgi:hypothetical protein
LNEPTLHALESFPLSLRSVFLAFPDEAKPWRPLSWDGIPSEPLTAIEQLCHIRDIEIEGYQVRLRRTLEEDSPWLPSIDTDALARDRRYGESHPATVLDQIRDARAETLRLIRTFTAEQLDRPAEFEGYGAVPLRSLVHFLCSHDQQHLSGLQWLLGKFTSRAAGTT